MAKITMDSSEWEAMKKNEKLLEEALLREQELGDKLEKAQEEKIQTLRNNEKSVTVVKQVHVNESLLCKVSIDHVMDRLNRLIISRQNSRESSMNHNRFHEDNFLRSQSGFGYREYDYELREIQSLFYTSRNQIRFDNDQESITYKGLDQVKAEIAQEYEDSMTKEHKAMIQSVGDMKKEISSLSKKERDNELIIKNSDKIISGLESDIKSLSKQLNLEKDRSVPKVFVSLTREILGKTRGIFFDSGRLKELDKLWEQKKD